LYESLAQRYMAPQPAPAPVPEVPEVDAPEPAVVDEITGDAPAEDGAPRQ